MNKYKDLETKGYVVLPNFFSQELIEKLVDHYRREKEIFFNTGGTNKNHPAITPKHFLLPELTPLMKEITENTNITLDITRGTCTYFDNKIVIFPWHQDHEPYYLLQDTYNAVNCWSPIIKSDKLSGGLGLLPNDVLASRCPGIFEEQIFGRGAKSLKVVGDQTVMTNDDCGGETVLPFNVEDIAEYPDIDVGDMLIFRQDVIHKTDTTSERVSVSVRCFNSNTVLTKENFLSGPDKKREIIGNNPLSYLAYHDIFVDQGIEQITIGELRKYQSSQVVQK